MNKKEAIQAMLDGKKVYRDCWGDDYVYFDEGYYAKDKNGTPYDMNCMQVVSHDYKIYQEPKKKVKLWQFVKDDGGSSSIFWTEDLTRFYDGMGVQKGNDIGLSNRQTHWIKTSNYIEVEV